MPAVTASEDRETDDATCVVQAGLREALADAEIRAEAAIRADRPELISELADVQRTGLDNAARLLEQPASPMNDPMSG